MPREAFSGQGDFSDDTPVWLFTKILAVSVVVIIVLLFRKKPKEEGMSSEESITESGDKPLK